jgi:hypothetical protein
MIGAGAEYAGHKYVIIAYSLLGQVLWCGCEFIVFTTCNIFTNYDAIFPTPGHMHTLPYHFGDDDDE